MHPGDFIITPSWTWHDHGNEADVPVVWLDGLDIPMVRFFDAGFAQGDTSRSQQVTRPKGTSFARFGHNMAPVRQVSPYGATSPIFSYPYERSREALERLERSEPVDDWDGVKLRYTNPLTGGWPMPTIGAFLQKLPRGFAGKAWRQTDGAVYSVVEGVGEVTIAHGDVETTYRFGPRDHFLVPSWHTARFSSAAGCVLFSFSDRPVHEALGIHSEERLS